MVLEGKEPEGKQDITGIALLAVGVDMTFVGPHENKIKMENLRIRSQMDIL